MVVVAVGVPVCWFVGFVGGGWCVSGGSVV